MDALSKTALIIPCYNEAGRLESDKFLNFILDNKDLDLFFVNDGSRDSTPEILENLSASAPLRIFLLTLETNKGKAEAVRQGFLSAMLKPYTFFGYWDADLSTPLDVLIKFLRILEENPSLLLIMGARVKLLGRNIDRKKMRHYLGRVFATLTSLLLRFSVYDTQCGAKLFRNNEIIKEIFSYPFISKWIFDVEILARLSQSLNLSKNQLGNRIIEYPLDSWREVEGSKLKTAHFVTGGIDLAKLAFKYYRNSR
jgi:dolichyl-phosphate beta-glucosyltransferase